ncbi:hypothetical protein [Embleya sp. NPDC005575]|uniref:hypothetical protein n=1 Tax=Embleya sp. NPDC005575 TaxID=3156892 RepID=UPI0033AE291B
MGNRARGIPAEQFPGRHPTLDGCQLAVLGRFRILADRVVQRPEPPRDVVGLAAEVRSHSGRLAAIEAVWDGDTSGPFVCLVAVHDDPPADQELALIPHGGDIRLLNGALPPWPEAVEADRTGRALAAMSGAPFHFASPETPDDLAP